MLNRSEDIDALSDLLRFLEARCELSGQLIAGGSWARRFGTRNAIKLCVATAGGCWYVQEGGEETAPRRFEAGDVLVMNGTRHLILAQQPALLADARDTPARRDAQGRHCLGEGEDFVMLGGLVHIDAERQSLLLESLPPLIHVRRDMADAEPLAWLLAQLVHEMQSDTRPGRQYMIAELTQLLFVQSLRAYLAQVPAGDTGWLKGFGDARLAGALRCIHGAPARDWSVETLAQEAGMSRTAFAVRFHQAMGMPPLAYLTHWRMQVAAQALRGGASVVAAASAAGYASESAFGSAFKRSMGVAPGVYRRRAATSPVEVPVHAEVAPL